MFTLYLTTDEIAELDDPGAEAEASWEGRELLAVLRRKIDRASGEITLNIDDIEAIQCGVFSDASSVWRQRLVAAFGRTLGGYLGMDLDG